MNGSSAFYQNNPAGHPVFIAGIKYPSLFDADLDSGMRSVSIWKALKKSGGYPVQIREALVVLDSWVYARIKSIKKDYSL
jgi:hypothetical protein